jgi:hypothetical protein
VRSHSGSLEWQAALFKAAWCQWKCTAQLLLAAFWMRHAGLLMMALVCLLLSHCAGQDENNRSVMTSVSRLICLAFKVVARQPGQEVCHSCHHPW